jgi:hypothetical protein
VSDRTDVTVPSSALPGVTRRYAWFSDAASAAGLSTIYAGVHTRTDHVAGLQLGTRVAEYVLAHTS